MSDEQDTPAPNIKALLHLAFGSDNSATDELTSEIENELRKIASSRMKRERPDHTLQTTALVNEVFIRLLGHGGGEWNDRKHFFRAASIAMRRLLVDHARRHAPKIDLDVANAASGPDPVRVLEIHRALEEFAAFYPEHAELIQLRFFAGLTIEKAADVLGISKRTANKQWNFAKAWLGRQLSSYKLD